MVSTATPLLSRDLDDLILSISASSAEFAYPGPLRVDTFLTQALALSQALPEARYVINLCDNRYHFMLAFCAVILRGQTNLLPANKTAATQTSLAQEYRPVYVLHDGSDIASGLRGFNIQEVSLPKQSGAQIKIPDVALNHLAAITFTSGSTGKAKANIKTWHTFQASTAINADYMLPNTSELLWQCATVPGQHMWGMETSVLLPMMRRVCVSDARPLFPADIANQLNNIHAPRLLVTTPVHLRAMTKSGLNFPKVQRILCATAPLTPQLAKESEALFSSDLIEIYGCSEVGSMAQRRSTLTDIWQSFRDINIEKINGEHIASASHLPETIALSDHLEKLSHNTFRLLGRSDDMVEIGGKRGSLQELNRILQEIPAVIDGVVLKIEGERAVNRIAAVVVLKPGVDKSEIITRFRERVDPVFVPRPIYKVKSLPRETNGKLPKQNILNFINELKGKV